MTTLMSWLMVLLVVSLASVTILATVLGYLTQTRWMRIFSEMQGIPATIMESSAPKEPMFTVPEYKKKKAFSMPIPGAQMFKSSK